MNSAVEDASLVHFEIQDNVLIANVELYWENHAEFCRLCDRMMQSDHKHIILDFSHVTFIFSAYMGTIGKLLADAAKADKYLTIRITRNLSWLFEIVGFDKMGSVEIVG